ncbi:hypothetical protein, partial [uncultured Megasphaera sp.]|uniref:hypothetical protein n=1 Tax=uncultured Megasphaera sp. TaxID=165188 RepID=UPI00266FBAE0
GRQAGPAAEFIHVHAPYEKYVATGILIHAKIAKSSPSGAALFLSLCLIPVSRTCPVLLLTGRYNSVLAVFMHVFLLRIKVRSATSWKQKRTGQGCPCLLFGIDSL